MANLKESGLTLAAVGLMALVVGLAYANSLRNDFVFDDKAIILENKLITHLENLPKLFTVDYWAGYRNPNEPVPFRSGLYRPLVLASYALNYAIGGFDPLGYHLMNIFLHFLVTWLLYLIAIQLGFSPEAAVISASLFAVHPLHTEAVTGIVGRAELLMALGVLGGFWWAIQGRPWLSMMAFAVGLFSKEQAVMLPALLVFYDACQRKTLARGKTRNARPALFPAAVARYGGYILVLVGYLVIRTLVLGGDFLPLIGFVENPMAYVDWYPRILTALKVAGRYLWLCVWPASLSADYSYNTIPIASSLMEPGVLLALLAWGSLLGLAVWSFRQDRRTSFCVGFTVLTFLPASNLLIPIGTIMGERLFYLPSAGLCLLVGVGWQHYVRWAGVEIQQGKRTGTQKGRIWDHASSPAIRLGGLLLFIMICLALTVRTVLRNRDWTNEETLFLSTVQVAPENAKIHYILGKITKAKGDRGQALEAYQTALRLYPDYPRRNVGFNNDYGNLLLELGRVEEAVEFLERAATLDPQWSIPQYNLGLAYAKQGRYPEAEDAFRRALALNPEDPDIYNSLSRLLIELGRFEEALAAAEAAIERKPEFLWAHFNRAWALEGLGRLEEAAAGYERVLTLDPALEDVKRRLRGLRARLGQARVD